MGAKLFKTLHPSPQMASECFAFLKKNMLRYPGKVNFFDFLNLARPVYLFKASVAYQSHSRYILRHGLSSVVLSHQWSNRLRRYLSFLVAGITGITGIYCLRTHKWVWSTAGYNSNVFIRITVVCYYCFTIIIICLHNTLTSLDSFFLLDISPIKVIYLNILGFFQ